MMFSEAQLRITADILISTGEVFLASLVVPFFVGEFSVAALIIGMLLMACAWVGVLSVGQYIKLA